MRVVKSISKSYPRYTKRQSNDDRELALFGPRDS